MEQSKTETPRSTPKDQRRDLHSTINMCDVTGATPICRGATKNPWNQGIEFENYKRRCVECVVGTPIRLEHQLADGSFEVDGKNCDLCGTRGVTWMCKDCKRVLCFDENRTKLLRDMLRTDDSDRLCGMAPEFKFKQTKFQNTQPKKLAGRTLGDLQTFPAPHLDPKDVEPGPPLVR
eukprot:scaffold227404_cov74-Cyclotella_meneghiniana.AAC.1